MTCAIKCDRCGERRATLHWTESFGGSIAERHLCGECQAEELEGGVAVRGEFRFLCRCGKLVRWRFPCGGCGHPVEAYEPCGQQEIEIEIGSCQCGARFLTVDPIWRCSVCGAESVVRPRHGGELGYLHDHIYGGRRFEEIKIRAEMP